MHYLWAFEADNDTLSMNTAQNIASDMIDYANQRRVFGDYAWIQYEVFNTQGGHARAAYLSEPYDYGSVVCSVEGVTFISISGYRSDIGNSLYSCLTTQDDSGDFIFSRSSQHQEMDVSQYTRSPYSGLVPLDQLGARSTAAQRVSPDQSASEGKSDPTILQRNLVPEGPRHRGIIHK